MSDVTQILSQIESGDPSAAEELLPLVYEELRRLAARRLADEKPGQALQATALVHEAWLRLVNVESAQHWDSRGHFFFSVAAEAMRRILVDNAHKKLRPKHGGKWTRTDVESMPETRVSTDENLLAPGWPVPKVIDFGVAKAISQRLLTLNPPFFFKPP